MNNEITEEHTKRIIEEYGKDEWYAVAQMSYPHLVDLCLTLRRQMRLANKRIADLKCDLNNAYFNEDGTVKK